MNEPSFLAKYRLPVTLVVLVVSASFGLRFMPSTYRSALSQAISTVLSSAYDAFFS